MYVSHVMLETKLNLETASTYFDAFDAYYIF